LTVDRIDAALLVLALTLATALGARRLRTPIPVVLAAAGIAFGVLWRFLPWLPPVSLPPDRVLFFFLPPLLTTAAYALPLGAFRANVGPITLLAVGLVLATMTAIAAAAHGLGALPWAASFVLGAIVAPPDPVAATSVAGSTGLPHRLVVILEGEGLLNDAVAITAYGLAVTAAVSGQFSWRDTAVALAREVPTGVAVGLAIGWGFAALRRHVDDVTIEAGISILTPYATYEIADRLGASAVLAVVTFGLVIQRRATEIASPASRLAARTVWNALQFASTALVFLLVGLLIGEFSIVRQPAELMRFAAAVVLLVIGLRFAWLFTVPRAIQAVSGASRPAPATSRELAVLSWAGMRGVVSLALALALPSLTTSGGSDARAVIVMVTLAVIVATLVLQGVTLLPLIEWLHVGDPEREARDEARTRARAHRAGLAALSRVTRDDGDAAVRYRALCAEVDDGRVGIAAEHARQRDGAAALTSALDAERRVVDSTRDAGRIGAALAERLVTEIDTDLLRLRGEVGRLTSSEAG
jgi:Na+/H+ antiporter